MPATAGMRDRRLAERAATGLPLAQAYAEAGRRPMGEEGGGSSRLNLLRQLVVSEYLNAPPERQNAILQNPLHRQLVYEYMSDPDVRRRFGMQMARSR